MKLKIVGCRHVYAGRNQKGDGYDIYEVDAAKPDGSLVNEKLRSFSALPIGQEVEVTVVPFDSEQYGRSYTLYLQGSRSTNAMAGVNELREEVGQQREMIAKLAERVSTLESGSPGAAPREQTQPSANGDLDRQFGAEAPW